MTNSKTPPASWMPSTSSSPPPAPQVRCAAGTGKTRWATADARATPSIRSVIFCAPHATGSPRANSNDSARPSRPMGLTSVSKSPTTAPNKSETSSTKTRPPKADASPPVSSRAYQRVPSPKSPAWAEPYASGRTHSWPTSRPTEPATAPPKPSTALSNWADAPPETTATPPTTDSACSSSPQAWMPPPTPNYEEPLLRFTGAWFHHCYQRVQSCRQPTNQHSHRFRN